MHTGPPEDEWGEGDSRAKAHVPPGQGSRTADKAVAALPVVPHPCLHAGYDRSYLRLTGLGGPQEPAVVRLVGR